MHAKLIDEALLAVVPKSLLENGAGDLLHKH